MVGSIPDFMLCNVNGWDICTSTCSMHIENNAREFTLHGHRIMSIYIHSWKTDQWNEMFYSVKC